MFEYSATELTEIESNLEPMLLRAKENTAEAEQMAIDATRLLTLTEDNLKDNRKQAFFKRTWGKLTDKSELSILSANHDDLLHMQKMSWKYIDMLNERNLMVASSMITVKNNLMALAITSEETQEQISLMADRIVNRFELLEDRMKEVEVQGNIHSWLLTLETQDYDEKYSPLY